MKKKTLLLLLLHLAVLMCFALCLFKFPEELVELKATIRRELNSARNDIQATSMAEFEASPVIEHTGDEWYQTTTLIYHAAGGIDGLTYSNSVEAMEHALKNGKRIIEIDFLYTSDGHLVCAHEWQDITASEQPLSLQEFRQLRIYGKYTAMTAADLLTYMSEYEDLYIVIDTKEDNAVQLVQDLVSLCGADSSIPSRFIIQLYDSGCKKQIMQFYPFSKENFLFTAYQFGTENPAQIMKLCYQDEICVITLEYGSWTADVIQTFTDKGFVLYEHTVNRPDEAREALSRGIHGLYTDFLMPEDLNP